MDAYEVVSSTYIKALLMLYQGHFKHTHTPHTHTPFIRIRMRSTSASAYRTLVNVCPHTLVNVCPHTLTAYAYLRRPHPRASWEHARATGTQRSINALLSLYQALLRAYAHTAGALDRGGICVLILVYILLYMCPHTSIHTAIYVSWY